MSTALRFTPAPRSAYQIERLLSGICEVAARLPRYVPGLSDVDRQFLYDVARGRHKFAGFERLLRLAARAEHVAVRMELAEVVRAMLGRSEWPTVVTMRDVMRAADVETEVQGPADVAMRQFEQHPNPATRAAAAAAIAAHLEASRTLLDAVQAVQI